MALMKLCRCGKKIEHNIKHCDSCIVEIDNEKREKVKRYDREVRNGIENKRYAAFYGSTAWTVLSDIVKLNYNGLCAVCSVEKICKEDIQESEVTHHIEELKEEWDLRLVEDNLIPLCHDCHNKLHVNYSKKDKIYLRNIVNKFKNEF